VVLRHVGVVVVLPREAIVCVEGAVDGQRRLDPALHRAPIDHGQGPRHALAHRTRLGVGRGTEGSRAAAEHLGARAELRVHLEPGADPVGRVAPTPLRAPDRASSGGFRSRHEVAPSYALATRRMVPSSKACPMIWSPMGNPVRVKPAGMERPGNPARLTGMVKMSFRYIWSGSSRSPILKATPGGVGATITSTRSKPGGRSRRRGVRTFCAGR